MTRAGSLARVSPALAGPVIVEGGIMKSLGIALAAFIVLSTAVAVADSIPTGDPVIRTGGGTGSIPITSPIFTIVTASGNSPTDTTPCILTQGGISTSAPGCFFLNDIKKNGFGTTINALLFVASKSDFSGTLSCALSTALGGPSPFTQCAVAGPVVTFFGGPGIPFGDDFSLGFRGFNPNASFLVNAISRPSQQAFTDPTNTPEPGTLGLFVGGIGALLVRRRARAG